MQARTRPWATSRREAYARAVDDGQPDCCQPPTAREFSPTSAGHLFCRRSANQVVGDCVCTIAKQDCCSELHCRPRSALGTEPWVQCDGGKRPRKSALPGGLTEII